MTLKYVLPGLPFCGARAGVLGDPLSGQGNLDTKSVRIKLD